MQKNIKTEIIVQFATLCRQPSLQQYFELQNTLKPLENQNQKMKTAAKPAICIKHTVANPAKFYVICNTR